MNLSKLKMAVSILSTSALLAGCGQITFTDPELEETSEETESANTSTETESTEEELPDPREYMSVVQPNRITTLNPTQISDVPSATAVNMIGEGLFRKRPDGSISQGAIEGELEIVDDNTIRANIHPDALWSNADPVVAEDFVEAWRELVNPDNNYYYGDILNNIVDNASAIQNEDVPVNELGVEAVDEKTLEITLENSIDTYDTLEELFAFPALYPIPSNFTEGMNTADYGQTAENTLSNGPYSVQNWQAGWETWQFTKNSGYWNSQQYPIDTISYQISNSVEDAMTSYDDQLVDVLNGFITENAGNRNSSNQGMYLLFNEHNNAEDVETPFANTGMRQLISQAVDKEELVNNLDWNVEIADSILPPAVYEGGEPSSDSENVSAEELSSQFNSYLEEIGYEAMEIDLLVDETEFSNDLADEIQTQLETKIEGLSVNITQIPNNVIQTRLQNQEYDLALVNKETWNEDDPLRYYSPFISDHSTNVTGYVNEEYDQLFEDLSYAQNINQNIYAQADEILENNQVVEPLVFLNSEDIYREEVINMDSQTITPWYDFYQASFEPGQYTVPLN